MKKIVYLVLFSTLLIACNNVKENKQEASESINVEQNKQNDLLPTKVIVYNEVNYKEQSIPEWLNGVDSNFMEQLNQKVIDSDLHLYSSNIYYEPDVKIDMTDDDIRFNIPEESEISALYFVESWSFNKASYTLEKYVESWSPVLEFYKKTSEGLVDSSRKAKKLLYDVRENTSSEEQLIAENITYEVSLSSEHRTSDYLDLNKLVHLIVEPVINGEKKAFDFFERTEMTPMDVRYVFGYSVDSLEEEDPVTGEWKTVEKEVHEEDLSEVEAFIFVEDWYIDTKTFAIRKQVKAVAPVIVRIKLDETTGESYLSKKIAFLVNME